MMIPDDDLSTEVLKIARRADFHYHQNDLYMFMTKTKTDTHTHSLLDSAQIVG